MTIRFELTDRSTPIATYPPNASADTAQEDSGLAAHRDGVAGGDDRRIVAVGPDVGGVEQALPSGPPCGPREHERRLNGIGVEQHEERLVHDVLAHRSSCSHALAVEKHGQ